MGMRLGGEVGGWVGGVASKAFNLASIHEEARVIKTFRLVPISL